MLCVNINILYRIKKKTTYDQYNIKWSLVENYLFYLLTYIFRTGNICYIWGLSTEGNDLLMIMTKVGA